MCTALVLWWMETRKFTDSSRSVDKLMVTVNLSQMLSTGALRHAAWVCCCTPVDGREAWENLALNQCVETHTRSSGCEDRAELRHCGPISRLSTQKTCMCRTGCSGGAFLRRYLATTQECRRLSSDIPRDKAELAAAKCCGRTR